MTKHANAHFHRARVAKNDAFYMCLGDIERELQHYKDQLRGKVIFCNCDDAYESNFFKYFLANFNHLGLKKLLHVGVDSSKIAGTRLTSNDLAGLKLGNNTGAYLIEIDGVRDFNKDGALNLDDVEYLSLIHI